MEYTICVFKIIVYCIKSLRKLFFVILKQYLTANNNKCIIGISCQSNEIITCDTNYIDNDALAEMVKINSFSRNL